MTPASSTWPRSEVGGGKKTWGQILGKAGADIAVIAVDQLGGPHQVVPKKVAEQILVNSGQRKSSASAAFDAGHAKRQAEDKARAEVVRRLQAEAVFRAEAASYSWLGAGPPFVVALTSALIGEFWSEIVKKVAARRKCESLDQHLSTLDSRQCLCLLVELVIARDEEPAAELLKVLKVDRGAIEKAVRKEAKEKTKKAGGK